MEFDFLRFSLMSFFYQISTKEKGLTHSSQNCNEIKTIL